MKKHLIVVLCGVCLLIAGCAGLPRDDELLEIYQRDREVFREIEKKIRNDEFVQGLATDPLLRRIGVKETTVVVRTPGFRRVMLIHSTRGFYHSMVAKGYVYSERPLEPEIKSLDGRTRREGRAYRHIEGYWHLFFIPD